MKTLLTTLIIFFSYQTSFCQEKLLVGKWKTAEVRAENFAFHRNDSIDFPEKFKNRSKVSLQNERAHITMTYSKNIFVFTSDGKFYLYKSDNPRTIIFDGKFKSENDSKIIFNVKNIAKKDVQTTAEYHFENGELYLKMYAENNSPINYVLTKFEN